MDILFKEIHVKSSWESSPFLFPVQSKDAIYWPVLVAQLTAV
jgi:hypothetical protein